MANQSIGKVEIGDIYEDTESGRRVKIGRLSVDQGSNEFFQKGEGDPPLRGGRRDDALPG